MARKRPIAIGFVDDDQKEIKIFEHVFGGDFCMYSDTRPQPLFEKLRTARARPKLFVLDLDSLVSETYGVLARLRHQLRRAAPSAQCRRSAV